MFGYNYVIADNQPLYRLALSEALAEKFSSSRIIELDSFFDLIEAIDGEDGCDIAFVNPATPGLQGFCGLAYLTAKYQDLSVVVISERDDMVSLHLCSVLGVTGFIPKTLSLEATYDAIEKVCSGEPFIPQDADLDVVLDQERCELVCRMSMLTPQQLNVLSLMVDGLFNKQIAYALDMTQHTVKAHISRILKTLNVENRTQAVLAVHKIENGFFKPHLNMEQLPPEHLAGNVACQGG